MHMTHRIRFDMRIASLGLALALVLVACGEGAAGPSVPGNRLMAPTPIRVTGTGGSGADAGAGGLAAAPEAAPIGSVGMIAPWAIFDYTVGPSMPALPTESSGWQYPTNVTPDLNRVARIAAALGISGDPVPRSADLGGGWIVGPEDGLAPALWVSADGQLSWWFNSAYPIIGTVRSGCATPVEVEPAPDGGTTDPSTTGSEPAPTSPEDCVFEPPSGILTTDQARAAVSELLVQMGEDPADFEIEVYADEWYASVSALPRLGSVTSPVSWYFGFGGEGRLEYAGGVLARPLEVGPYPLVDLDTAVARLSDGYFGGIRTMEADALAAGSPDVMCPEGMECPVPLEPEHIQITLTGVVADLWWAWEADGTVWLLPAYTFLDADGGRYTVPAVTDEYLVMDDLPVDPGIDQPAPPPAVGDGTVVVEPGDGTIVDGGTVEPGVVISEADAAALVGLSEDEALATAAEHGWAARVVARDGEQFAVTEDYSTSRVNLTIVAGTVTAVTVG